MRLDLIVFRIKVSKTKPNTSFSTPPNKAIRFCSINVPWVSYQNIWHFKRETVWRSHCTTWESEERHWHIENRSAHSITNQLGSSICPRFSSSLQLSCFISRSVILPQILDPLDLFMRSQFCYWLLPSGAKSYCGLIIPTIVKMSVKITLKANSSGSQHHRGQMSRKAEFVDKYSWLSHYPQYLPSTFEATQSSP